MNKLSSLVSRLALFGLLRDFPLFLSPFIYEYFTGNSDQISDCCNYSLE